MKKYLIILFLLLNIGCILRPPSDIEFLAKNEVSIEKIQFNRFFLWSTEEFEVGDKLVITLNERKEGNIMLQVVRTISYEYPYGYEVSALNTREYEIISGKFTYIKYINFYEHL